jgi:hexosaminidase
MIEWYLLNVFKCETSACARKATLVITIDNGDIIVPTAVEHERYTISITNRDSWTLNANYYPGFLRGLETFSQLFELNDQEESEIVGLPILISDGPQFRWRGFMIDTSRHYMPVSTVKRALDSMLYSKLNVLHWHIIDEDSFPMVVPTVPELSEFGSVGGIFTPEDIQSVIDYARLRGIRVIPEIDTPAHTRSWGRSEKYKDITLDCNGIYMGQFDPTINTTWEVVEKVMDFVNTTFQD